MLEASVLDVETNPGPRRPVPDVCRILCSNVQGLAGNLSDLTVASSQYDMQLCSETLVSDMRDVLEVLVPAQPTTFDHINIKYIWGPQVNHMGTTR